MWKILLNMLSKILCILQISHVEIYMENMKEIQQNIIWGLVLGDVVIGNDDFLFFSSYKFSAMDLYYLYN